MFACQWHFDIPFGTQKDVLEILKQYGEAISNRPSPQRGGVG